MEQRIITEVASYGRKLGRLLEAIDLLVQRQSRRGLEAVDRHELDQVHALAERVAAMKEQAAVDYVDRIVADVRVLIRDQQANADAIRRPFPSSDRTCRTGSHGGP